MLDMLSHPRRPQSGHLMCYLNRTYHVLPTYQNCQLDSSKQQGHAAPSYTLNRLHTPLHARFRNKEGFRGGHNFARSAQQKLNAWRFLALGRVVQCSNFVSTRYLPPHLFNSGGGERLEAKAATSITLMVSPLRS